jgi:hypothetical protein
LFSFEACLFLGGSLGFFFLALGLAVLLLLLTAAFFVEHRALRLLFFIAGLSALDTQDLHDVGSCVDAGGGGAEHLLQENVG